MKNTMPKKKIAPSKEEEPVVNIVDRRSALLDEVELEELNSEEERLPSYVEKLKKEAEEKEKKLKEELVDDLLHQRLLLERGRDRKNGGSSSLLPNIRATK